MTYCELNHWLGRQIPVPRRLRSVCFGLILFLMISARKHSLKAAGEFVGLHSSQFSRFLSNHLDLARASLSQLSRKQARILAKRMRSLANNKLPWTIAIIIDSTLRTVPQQFAQHMKLSHAEHAASSLTSQQGSGNTALELFSSLTRVVAM